MSACDSEAISTTKSEKDKQLMILANIESIKKDKEKVKNEKKELNKRLNDAESQALPDPAINPTKKIKTKSADGSVTGEKAPGYHRNGSNFLEIMSIVKSMNQTPTTGDTTSRMLKDKMLLWYTEVGKQSELQKIVHAYFRMDNDDDDVVECRTSDLMAIIREASFRTLLSIFMEPGKVANKENFKTDCSKIMKYSVDEPLIPFRKILVLYEIFEIIKKMVEEQAGNEGSVTSSATSSASFLSPTLSTMSSTSNVSALSNN